MKLASYKLPVKTKFIIRETRIKLKWHFLKKKDLEQLASEDLETQILETFTAT